ncbi:hypothetical protein ACPA54_15120 [Uniformispora flossi]|uniref:hypothetical protein n=1 Tax=Uniformispora flossi TaxID=3390723 RepID=UPI003C2B82FB
MKVEYSIFGIEDDEINPLVPWIHIELPRYGFRTGLGGAVIVSGIQEHDAHVELMHEPPGDYDAEWEFLGEQEYQTTSGEVRAWTLLSGPTDVKITLNSRSRYSMHVYRRKMVDSAGTPGEKYNIHFCES